VDLAELSLQHVLDRLHLDPVPAHFKLRVDSAQEMHALRLDIDPASVARAVKAAETRMVYELPRGPFRQMPIVAPQVPAANSNLPPFPIAAPAPRARTRPGHNTPLLVLYGSNLGTAEELATRVADLAEVNGFATKLAPLDDFAGKLPEQGGVLIFCASYNGAPPDNATQFIKWLGDDLPKDAFSKVRYAVFGCGNSDWAATYQSIPRIIDEQLAAHGARSVHARGEVVSVICGKAGSKRAAALLLLSSVPSESAVRPSTTRVVADSFTTNGSLVGKTPAVNHAVP